MAQDITLMGASYPSVPAVNLPKTGGGTARFDDTSDATAMAEDIAQGKTAYVNGSKITGTASGGGGGEEDLDNFFEKKLVSYSHSTVTTIPAYVFIDQSLLTSINLPKLESIASYTFGGCTKLQSATFAEVTSIQTYAFRSCTSLAYANFPRASLIGSSAFYGCTSLRTISFPSLRTVSASAFYMCRYLESAYFLGSSVPSLANRSVFANTGLSNSASLGHFGSIFVRESMVSAFRSATNWSYYSARVVGLTDAQIAALG